jgi:hypothetical protein
MTTRVTTIITSASVSLFLPPLREAGKDISSEGGLLLLLRLVLPLQSLDFPGDFCVASGWGQVNTPLVRLDRLSYTW